MKYDRRKLQLLIDRAAKAHTEASSATAALNEYCEELYGVAPADVDADSIIDAVLGGCGACHGMDAAEFHDIMLESTGGGGQP